MTADSRDGGYVFQKVGMANAVVGVHPQSKTNYKLLNAR
jgi:hypothetical protein